VREFSIFEAAREAPDDVCLIDGDTELTFREVAERTQPLQRRLLAARPKSLALTPRADTASLLWLYAALASATPVLPLHTRATPDERAHAIALAGASEGDFATLELAHAHAPAPVSVDAPAPVSVDPESTLAYLATSGSTGAPRLVQLSRRALLASAHASAQNLGWEPNDRWLLCLPLAHAGGLSIVLRCLAARRSVLLFEPGPRGVLGELDRLMQVATRATLISLVPSVLAALLEAGFVAPPGLRAVLVGGAGTAPALAERAHAAGLPLLTSYGLTETGSQVVTRRYAERYLPLPVRDGVVSSGHGLPGVELRLRDGAIALRSPTLFSGYVGDPQAALAPDGFLLTNDRGELGVDGELYVRGRRDDVIVTGGENVEPLEVEAALTKLSMVDAACVFGTPSERFGEVVTALLVTHDPRLADPAVLTAQLAERLARHKCPRRVLVVSELLLTGSGKVDRRACRALFLRTHPGG
jgi:O-succinylbenzoic acid--CoA ligase